MYSPKIKENQVRQLYKLKVSLAAIGISKPMTQIVAEALEKYITEKAEEIKRSGGTVTMPDELTRKSS